MGVHQLTAAVSVMKGRRAEWEALVGAVMRRAAMAGSDYLTYETPVKTGLARSNWVATLDEPFEGTIPAYAPFEDLGAHEAAPIERKQETGNLHAARAQNKIAYDRYEFPKNRSIFFRNNVDHIGLLKDGRSLQSPPGWFEQVTLVSLRATVGIWKLKD